MTSPHIVYQRKFKDRKIKRNYLCITLNSLPKCNGIIDEKISKDQRLTEKDDSL